MKEMDVFKQAMKEEDLLKLLKGMSLDNAITTLAGFGYSIRILEEEPEYGVIEIQLLDFK